jgi:hypothetical protein
MILSCCVSESGVWRCNQSNVGRCCLSPEQTGGREAGYGGTFDGYTGLFRTITISRIEKKLTILSLRSPWILGRAARAVHTRGLGLPCSPSVVHARPGYTLLWLLSLRLHRSAWRGGKQSSGRSMLWAWCCSLQWSERCFDRCGRRRGAVVVEGGTSVEVAEHHRTWWQCGIDGGRA